MQRNRWGSTAGLSAHQHCDVAGDLSQRRRAAVKVARDEAIRAQAGIDPDSSQPALGTCTYGPGCLSLALAGRFDRTGLERLQALGRRLKHLAHTELVIDCSALTSCEPALARALARLRIQCLTAGAIVELYEPPEALANELGTRPATKFTLVDLPDV